MNQFIELFLQDEEIFVKSAMRRHLEVEQIGLRKICECLEGNEIEKAYEIKEQIGKYSEWFKKEKYVEEERAKRI